MNEQRPWLKNYPSGVPANIDPTQYESLLQMLEESFTKFGSKPAFSNLGKILTYKQIDRLSGQFAGPRVNGFVPSGAP